MKLPARIEVSMLAMLAFINLYMTRTNLSVISVAMVKRNISANTGGSEHQCQPSNCKMH